MGDNGEMERRWTATGGLLRRTGLGLALLGLPAARPALAQLPPATVAQPILEPGVAPPPSKKQAARPAPEKDPGDPSLSIPVGPLGFAPPSPYYLGERFAMVSLTFLDENRLLFAFRVPGLIAREQAAAGQATVAERHIRALTLELPTGKVAAESLWVLHDYGRFLWPMKGQKFLLRDRNLLQVGDGGLRLEPFLRFPGPLNAIQLDPTQRLLIADTTEAPAPSQQSNSAAKSGENLASGPAASTAISNPTTAAASMVTSGSGAGGGNEETAAQRLVRILSLETRKVMLFSRANGSVHLPLDGEGYYDTLRGAETKWLVVYEFLNGASKPVGLVDSSCDPGLEAVAPGIVVTSACLPNGARHLTALARDRDKDHARLWDLTLPPTKVWPQWCASGDGMRFARATLEVGHPIGIYNPLDESDIRGQSVQVYDLATGSIQLTAPLSPVLDGGGNFALSPSGRRLAVLNAGSIQVYDLGPVAALPPVAAAPQDGVKP